MKSKEEKEIEKAQTASVTLSLLWQSVTDRKGNVGASIVISALAEFKIFNVTVTGETSG